MFQSKDSSPFNIDYFISILIELLFFLLEVSYFFLLTTTMTTLFGRRHKSNSRKRQLDEILQQHVEKDEKLTCERVSAFKASESGGADPLSKPQTKPQLNFDQQPPRTFADLGLVLPLLQMCRSLGLMKPTPVQRTVIPFLLNNTKSHVLCLAPTGSGKTAAFVLPILQHLQQDPYGIYAVVLTPTRELAKQLHQQVLALGSCYKVTSVLVVGGLDMVHQACRLQHLQPHMVVATPGRLAELLRGSSPPNLSRIRYMVLDEADRLLAGSSGFERDVAEILLHTTIGNHSNLHQRQPRCQTLLFSATMTKSLESMEELAGAGRGRLPLVKFVIRNEEAEAGDEGLQQDRQTKKQKQDSVSSPEEKETEEDHGDNLHTPTLPAGLKQEYVFMPSKVRDAYLMTVIRRLVVNGGRKKNVTSNDKSHSTKAGSAAIRNHPENDYDDDDDASSTKARSAIIFVSTCERCALVSGILRNLGVPNVALHSLLSQNRRLAALAKFQSNHVSILVATDVASRGLDIPTVDLVINAELPRQTVVYIHRVGRTARAGRRGRAISLVGESDVGLVKAAERLSGRVLDKCSDVTEDQALKLLGPVTKAARLAKMKLMDIGFDELVKKMRERKDRDRQERLRKERRLKQRVVEKHKEHTNR
jgi:ATP-dependent RNA helicase DDX49/DBP8